MKKLLIIGIWVIMVVGMAVLLGFAINEQSKTTVQGIEIDIDYQGGDYFVTAKEVKEHLLKAGISMEKRHLSDVDAEFLEQCLMQMPYVKKADVYTTLSGNVKVHVLQRNPIVRIVTGASGFYLDGEGNIMQPSKKYSARVMVVLGDSYLMKKIATDRQMLDKIYSLAKTIKEDVFLSSFIDQVYMNSDKNFELIPIGCPHTILLGNLDNLDEKIFNLKAFYKKGIPKAGWNKYKTINLKYKNQVVCSKI